MKKSRFFKSIEKYFEEFNFEIVKSKNPYYNNSKSNNQLYLINKKYHLKRNYLSSGSEINYDESFQVQITMNNTKVKRLSDIVLVWPDDDNYINLYYSRSGKLNEHLWILDNKISFCLFEVDNEYLIEKINEDIKNDSLDYHRMIVYLIDNYISMLYNFYEHNYWISELGHDKNLNYSDSKKIINEIIEGKK